MAALEFPPWSALLSISQSFYQEIPVPRFISHIQFFIFLVIFSNIFSLCAEVAKIFSFILMPTGTCIIQILTFPHLDKLQYSVLFLPANVLSSIQEILHTDACIFCLDFSLVFVAYSFKHCNGSLLSVE